MVGYPIGASSRHRVPTIVTPTTTPNKGIAAMTTGADIRFTEAELDAIADRISRRILLTLTPERHYNDHVWAKLKQDAESNKNDSTRRVMEAILGTTFAASILAGLVWLGAAILRSRGVGG